jgi:hypothetical protein
MKTNRLDLLRRIAAWGIIAYFAVQLLATFPQVLPGLQPLFNNDNLSYDDKMRLKWAGNYDLVQWIVQDTPETAGILMDNANSPPIDLYFLYPRHLFYGGEKDFQAHPEIGYIVVSSTFPDFPVSCEKHMVSENVGICRILR